ASVAVTITAPPGLTVTPPANQGSNEGATATFSLGSFGGGVSPYSVTVTWGDGTSSSFAASPGAISAAHKYVNDGSYTVSVKVTDATSASATGGFTIAVANLAPTVTVTSPASGTSFQTNNSVTAKA